MYQVLLNLKVYPENMMKNIEATMGLIFSEAVMIALVRKGYDRQKAHELLRVSCLEAMRRGVHLKEILKNTEVSRYLSDEELDELFEPGNYLGKAVELTERVALSTLKFVEGLIS
jgi:adenylosuccinate lyase